LDIQVLSPYNEILTLSILRLVMSSQSTDMLLHAPFHPGAKGLTGEENMVGSQKNS
jgi:hypothetical protein